MRLTSFLLLAALMPLSVATATRGREPHDSHGHDHLGGTHQPAGAGAERHTHAHPGVDLSHPIVTESPVPETKVRFNYGFADADDAEEHEAELELEYAFTTNVSVEAVVPYVFVNPEDGDSADRFGDAEVALKVATYRFTEMNLLPAAGVAVTIPTGNEERGVGSDHVVELEPFVRLGYWRGPFEVIGTVDFAIPLNQKGGKDDEEDFALGYNLSLLYHVADDVQLLAEFHGKSVFGADDDAHAFYVSPGVTLQPFEDKSINLGLGISLPVTDDREFDYAVNLMTIIHF